MAMRVCGRPNVGADVAQVRTVGIRRRAGISRQPPDAKHFLTECQAQHFLDYVLAGLPVCLPACLACFFASTSSMPMRPGRRDQGHRHTSAHVRVGYAGPKDVPPAP